MPLSQTVALETWAHVWKTLAKVQRWIVAPAVVVATLTGVALTMRLGSRPHGAGLAGMMAFGVVAAILALAVVSPLANRMGWVAEQSLADRAKDPSAESVRKRLALVGTVTGLCVLAAMYFGAMAPPVGGGE